MADAKLKLQARKDSVDITKLALQGGVYSGFTTIDVRSLEDAVVRYGVAQALMDGLASTEEGLAVRDILPDLDTILNVARILITSGRCEINDLTKRMDPTC